MKTQCWYWVLYYTMSQAQSLTTVFSVHFKQNEHETIKHKSIQNSDCEWTSVIKVGIKNKLSTTLWLNPPATYAAMTLGKGDSMHKALGSSPSTGGGAKWENYWNHS